MSMSESIFYEDVVPGRKITIGPYHVTKEEVMEFSRKWNPLPFHIDEEAAKRTIYGGITAPSIYTLAVRTMLLDQLHMLEAMLGTVVWDDVRFHKPVRPGDDLTVEMEWVEKRVSNSKPDRGLVKMRITMLNQRSEAVMSQYDTIMMRLRETPTARGSAAGHRP
jgi:acyl dehydratase